MTQQTIELESEAAHLNLLSPISGVVVTPRVRDHVGGSPLPGLNLWKLPISARSASASTFPNMKSINFR